MLPQLETERPSLFTAGKKSTAAAGADGRASFSPTKKVVLRKNVFPEGLLSKINANVNNLSSLEQKIGRNDGYSNKFPTDALPNANSLNTIMNNRNTIEIGAT